MAIRNTTVNRRLNGLNPLSYMGENATTPPEFYSISRDPGVNDWQDFMLCDLWLNTVTQNVWVLVSLNNNQATWVMLAGGGFGPIIGLQPDVGAVVHAIGGVVNIHNPPIQVDGNLVIENGTIEGNPTNYLDIKFSNTIQVTNSIFAGIRNGIVTGENQMIVFNNSTNNTFYSLGVNTFNATSSGSGLALFHGRGTFLAPLPTVSGDDLGRFDFYGFDGAVVSIGASVRSTTSGTIVAGRVPSDLEFWTTGKTAPGLFQRMTISTEGNVTINVPVSGVALNSISTFGQAVGGSGVAVVIDNAGNFGTVVSSAKFKENIVDMLTHSELIMKLRPVIFNYIEDKFKNTSVGLIAEEVAEIFPDLAVKDANGNITTVKYLDLIPMLLNELQKLTKRVEALETKY